MARISIEGNIGCGKSSIISRLCQEERLPVFLEPVEEWKEWLTEFYKDPERWRMSFNINVLLSFEKWKNNNFLAVYERSPISNRHVFTKLQHDEGSMTDLELNLFDQLYSKLAWTPDIIIYIRTDPEVSHTRMQKRGRECENGVTLEYLTSLHKRYDMVLKEGMLDINLTNDKKNCIIVTIDGNRSHDEVYADVVMCIKSFLQP